MTKKLEIIILLLMALAAISLPLMQQKHPILSPPVPHVTSYSSDLAMLTYRYMEIITQQSVHNPDLEQVILSISELLIKHNNSLTDNSS